jgi:hypothetical protein
VSWLAFLFPVPLGAAEIRVLTGAHTGETVSVSFIVRTLTLAKTNEFTEVSVPGLNGQPLRFVHGGTRTLSVMLSFDGRATNTDVRQPMTQVARLMSVDRDTHAPPVLSFEWRGQSFQCVLESLVEKFRAVFPDGRPSRGRMHVVLRESRTVEQLQQELALQ